MHKEKFVKGKGRHDGTISTCEVPGGTIEMKIKGDTHTLCTLIYNITPIIYKYIQYIS